MLKWDDSAAKDALFDAQKRFCSMINSLPHGPPLPDPDMYIDKIDWNPEIDPGLMSDLDKEYFNPDEAENLTSNEIPDCNNKNKSTLDNPWESHRLENKPDIKDLAQSWKKWGDSLESKDEKWGSSVNKPFGWNKGLNDTSESTKHESDYVNSWNRGALHSKSPNEKGWGDASKNSGWNCGNSRSNGWGNTDNVDSWGDALKNSGEWNCGNSRSNEWGNTDNVDSWRPLPGRTSNYRQFTKFGNSSRNSKWSTNQNNDTEKFDSRIHSGACRKREEYQENTSRRKSWKHEGADFEAHQFWGKARPQGQYYRGNPNY